MRILIFTSVLFLIQTKHCTNAKNKNETFTLKYKWETVNFTWPSCEFYQNAIKSKRYIPENCEIKGLKIYKEDMYFALPLYKPGIPVTLGIAKKNNWKPGTVIPFPSWDENDRKNCSNFQSVQGFEVDSQGLLWVIDGERKNKQSSCPCKLVLLDLNQKGKRVHTFIFPNELCQNDTAFLNDIVVDETDGGYAYITDHSFLDPGVLIYSKKSNRAWKLRDKSMFADLEAADFLLSGAIHKTLDPVDGIALSPRISAKSNEKTLFYSAVTSYNLYGISTNIVKNEELCLGDQWRRNVTLIGRRQGPSDGMVFNKRGDLYYTLMAMSAVGKWNFKEPFNTSTIIDQNVTLLKEPNTFAFDDTCLYLLNDKIITTLNTTSKSYLNE